MGEVLHQSEEVDIHGTSVFASDVKKTQGTFTTHFGLRYALIGFSGVANEHSAKLSRLSNEDYELFLRALWNGVRSAANTRTKRGQIPHLHVGVEYKEYQEFQFGRLQDYVRLHATNGKGEKEWSSPADFRVHLEKLLQRFGGQEKRIQRVSYSRSADIQLAQELPETWKNLDLDACN